MHEDSIGIKVRMFCVCVTGVDFGFVNAQKLRMYLPHRLAIPYQFIAYVRIIKVHVCHDGCPSYCMLLV